VVSSFKVVLDNGQVACMMQQFMMFRGGEREARKRAIDCVRKDGSSLL
jgi:hypothetical protein